jgi:hypothetical protein
MNKKGLVIIEGYQFPRDREPRVSITIAAKHQDDCKRPQRGYRSFSWIDAICLYVDQYRTKYRGNVRLRPSFSEGFHFALVALIHRSLLIPLSHRVSMLLKYLLQSEL